MKVSVVMATYNGEKYVEQQILSICNQSQIPYEIVISDDNSTDSTLKVLKKLKESFKSKIKIRIFRNKNNSGHVSNFSYALRFVRGDFIALCDQDDFWYPNKLATFLKRYNEIKNFDAYMHDALLVDSDLSGGTYTKLLQLQAIGLTKNDYWMGCATIIKFSKIKPLLPIPPGIVSHDVYLLEPLKCLNKVIVDTKVLMKYRRHKKNVSSGLGGSSNNLFKASKLKNFSNNIVQSLRAYDHSQSLEKDIRCLEVSLSPYKRFLDSLVDEGHQKIIKDMLIKKNKILIFQIARKGLLRMPIYSKIFYGYKFFLEGRYRLVNGFQSFLRDILSKS